VSGAVNATRSALEGCADEDALERLAAVAEELAVPETGDVGQH
jgi:hypothetical protein